MDHPAQADPNRIDVSLEDLSLSPITRPTGARALADIHIATPCPADWNRMGGNDRVRFCSQCMLHVYNLSGMTEREAETLINEREGHLCVRYYQRQDGTVLTSDCPVGMFSRGRRRVLALCGGLVAAVAGIVGVRFGPRQQVMGDVAEPPGTRETAGPPSYPPAIMGTPRLPPRIGEVAYSGPVPTENPRREAR